jgi:hypothetical protein
LGSTKWPGRGSSTVFEKIKTDFNGSSKSSPDRVAQIKLPRPSSQPQSRPAGVELRELDEPWGDLTDKLKSLILTSFDLLGNEIPLQNVRVRLVESADVSPREIWLENGQDVLVKAEASTIVVETDVSTLRMLRFPLTYARSP